MLLELLQLADSALPVGATAHSFGLETLVERNLLRPDNLAEFLDAWLEETAALESSFVNRAWIGAEPCALSIELDARKPARESREASRRIGRRFAELFNAVTGACLPSSLHYSIGFGAAGHHLSLPEDAVLLAYLQQSVTGLISVCQRLMPLGQVAAAQLLWDLKPAILRTVSKSKAQENDCFSPLPELGSMLHSQLETRLFIS